MLVVLCTSSLKYLTVFVSYDKRSHSSRNQGRRPRAWGPRCFIEIVKCTIFRTNCATLNVIKSHRNPQIYAGSRVEFQEMGDRFATLFECSLNSPSDSY